ncbi:MAG TPA: helix-turn-helix domain-containing protein [Candidatus Cybelea sp.]|nr:helix-turn-helix domain-containing protein [Candidatus Cybelea sp.]
MTPFGARVRELRQKRGVTLKQMAADIGISAAFLSALEHGHRGRPPFALVQAICAYFHIIWDEAEELQRLAEISHPRVVIDTSGLTPKATEVANRLARSIRQLPDETLAKIEALLKRT